MNPLIEAASSAPYVLLGEASHGTSEFYTIRAELSKRLIVNYGYRFIAVEGDWPTCFEVNRYVKNAKGAAASADEALRAFRRWPEWMWANEEIRSFIEWLREYNDSLPPGAVKVGFYGIDVYSLWESLDEIIAYLERTGSKQLETARKAFACFDAYDRDEQSYAVSAGLFDEGCEDEVVKLLAKLRKEKFTAGDRRGMNEEERLSAEINALVGVNAEHYYRIMVKSDANSWNVRDRHMTEALEHVAAFYGQGAKGIVWEHNTHIGDARATDMASEGMVNVGQLLREKHGKDQVYAVGFGTNHGTVIAGDAWGTPYREMTVPHAVSGSWEALLHRTGAENKYMLLDETDPTLNDPIGHRAIGVVYHPRYERRGNYVPTVIPKRYDAFVYVDESNALKPLALHPVHS
ncbi:erythromycin esterase family protein [Paenibacillus thermotolerans]|uniref:erythromycin esterase family protein n=1 Tax=Paenibacillus thermotolerans TaxID=3027807 RepID=UPI003CC5C504